MVNADISTLQTGVGGRGEGVGRGSASWLGVGRKTREVRAEMGHEPRGVAGARRGSWVKGYRMPSRSRHVYFDPILCSSRCSRNFFAYGLSVWRRRKLVLSKKNETSRRSTHLILLPFFRASRKLATSPPHRKRPNKMDQDWKPGTCASPLAVAGVPARLRSSSAAVSVSRPRVTRPQDD